MYREGIIRPWVAVLYEMGHEIEEVRQMMVPVSVGEFVGENVGASHRLANAEHIE